jgi:ABC-type amino acid transport substrate-binding protein
VIVSVVAFAFLSFLVTLSYYGKLRLRAGRFAMALLLPALALAVIAWAGPQAHGYFASGATTYPTLALDPALTREVRATIYRNAAEYDQSGDAAVKSAATGTTTGDIHLAGALRVGYNASVMPFCYVNDAGDLVGFDVAQAYTLARALNVRLVFIPFERTSLERDLLAERFDLAMAGIYATAGRLSRLSASEPYFQSPLALFLPEQKADRFRMRDQILAM